MNTEPGRQTGSGIVPTQPQLTGAEKQRVLRAASRHVAAIVRGQTPDSLDEVLADLAERPVLGSFVSLKRGGKLRSCCGYMGEGIRLAEAVANAAVRAARHDPRFPPIAAEELDQLDVEVWLLWNLELVPGRGERRTAGFQIGKHGLQIAHGHARGLLLPCVAVEHKLDAAGFLRQVCLKARLPADQWKDDAATLMRFEGLSIGGRLADRTADESAPTAMASDPNPLPGPPVRSPAVAGSFYPGSETQLNRELDTLLADRPEPEAWAGALVPHAGWVYSGRLAAAVLGRVRIPGRVVILAPKHKSQGANWAVAPHRVWSLPGADVESDPELARQLADAVDGLELDPLAHRQEHAIEVQLPLLARLAPHARVVGITIHGAGELADLQRFAGQMADALSSLAEMPLLVASSDMSHVSDDAKARRLDRLALDSVESLDPAGLYHTVMAHQITMCGVRPAVVVMETLRRLGRLSRCEAVGYATSADVSPDADRTVGYAGVLFN